MPDCLFHIQLVRFTFDDSSLPSAGVDRLMCRRGHIVRCSGDTCAGGHTRRFRPCRQRCVVWLEGSKPPDGTRRLVPFAGVAYGNYTTLRAATASIMHQSPESGKNEGERAATPSVRREDYDTMGRRRGSRKPPSHRRRTYQRRLSRTR